MAEGYGCLPYLQWNPFIGFSLHEGIVPIPAPPFVIVMKLPHISFSVVNGLWLFSNPSTGNKEVTWNGVPFLGRTSDAGFFVPHISIPPQILMPLTTLFGGSMAVFGSSSVLMGTHNLIFGDGELSPACTPFGPVPLSMNLGCNEPISWPLDIVVLWGTTKVGFTLGDFIAGLIDIALQIVVEGLMIGAGALLGKAFKKVGSAFKKTATTVVEEAATEVAEEASEKAASSWSRKVSAEAAEESMDTVWDSAKKASGGIEDAIYRDADEALSLTDEALDVVDESAAGVGDGIEDSIYRQADEIDESFSAADEVLDEVDESLSAADESVAGVGDGVEDAIYKQADDVAEAAGTSTTTATWKSSLKEGVSEAWSSWAERVVDRGLDSMDVGDDEEFELFGLEAFERATVIDAVDGAEEEDDEGGGDGEEETSRFSWSYILGLD